MKKSLSFSLFLFFISTLASAQTGPREFNFSGQLTDSVGNPVLNPSITFTIKILSPGSCLIYEESQMINTTASNGNFSVGVGSAVGSAKRTANDAGNTMPNIFRNAGTITGDGCSYSPNAGDSRQLVVTVDDGITVETLSAQTIRSVPTAFMAENSERVGGYAPADLLRVNTSGAQVLSQSNIENVFTSSNYATLTSLLAGTSPLYNRPATNGTNTLPSLSSPTSPSAGQIWYNAGNIYYHDGSATRTLSTGGAGVTTFNARSGAVVPMANDYTWAQINKTTSSLADLTTRSAADLNSGTLADARLSSNIPFLNSNNTFTGSNTFSVGNQVIETGAPANNALIVRGASGQTAPLFVVQNNASASIHVISQNGAGLGTTNPARLLHVNGSMRLAPTTAPGSAATGDIYMDSATSKLRYYDGITWVDLEASGGGGGSGDFMADGSIAMTGALRAATGTSVAPSITFSGDTDSGFYNSATNSVSLALGGAERMRFDTAGVFSTMPSAFSLSHSATAALPPYSFNGDSDTGLFRPSADTVGFTTAGTERMRIDATGRVAIGTTFPMYSFEVAGPSTSAAITRSTDSAPVTAAILRIQRSRGTPTSPLIVQNGDTLMNILAGGYNGVGSYDVAAKIDAIVDGTPSSTQMPGALLFSTRDTGAGNPTERMRITNAGNIGIGTTAPTTRLNVNGTLRIGNSGETCSAAGPGSIRYNGSNIEVCDGSSWSAIGGGGGSGDFMADGSVPMIGNLRLNGNWLSGDGSNEGVYVSNNGNVGIGTSAPAALLEVVGNSAAMQAINSRNSNSVGTNFYSVQNDASRALLMGVTGTGFSGSGIYQPNHAAIYSDTNLNGLNIGAEGPRPVALFTNNIERMRIDSGGYVGIGTTAPFARLHVNGTMRIGDSGEICSVVGAGGLKWNGSAMQFCDGVSWISMGANMFPGGSNGQIQFNSGGIFGGDSTFVWDNTNKRLGIGIPSPATAIDVVGTVNTSNGYHINGIHALKYNSTNSNLAFAPNGLNVSATGGENLAFGDSSLAGITTGQYNIGLGRNTLQVLTSGSSNIGIGNAALYTNLSNVQNVAIGHQAGRYIQGDANTAIGHNAMRGTASMSSAYNTSLGYQSGMALVTGGHNVLLGANAGAALTSGSQNIIIGSTAGNTTPTTGGGNILIGFGTQTSAPSSTGELRIGNYISGVSGNVGIGVNNPSQKLEVYNGSTTGSYTTSGWTHSSDIRLKHDIRPLENSLEKIVQLQGVEYRFNSDPADKLQVGFIAQQAEAVFPEVVETDNKGFKSMVYANLVAPLVEAVKTLYAKFQQQDETIAKQEAEIKALKDYICQKDREAPFCQ